MLRDLNDENELCSKLMLRCVKKAEAQIGLSSPNPWVGACVIPANYSSSDKLYFGVTQKPGENHAEIEAIKKTPTQQLKGATLVVTLEPCSHWGKTPPCTQAILEAGIKKVVIGTIDPDERMNSKSIKALKKEGLEVVVGVEEDKVKRSLGPYLTYKTKKRPFVTLKLAMTIDGKIAAPDYSSKFITGEAARKDVQRLRLASDAILIGKNTLLKDNPSLRPHIKSRRWREPMRVVLGEKPADDDFQVEPATYLSGDLIHVLGVLHEKGVINLLVEGGGVVANEFYSNKLVDRYIFYVAPKLFGGSDAKGAFEGQGAQNLEEVLSGSFVSVKRLGDDLKIIFEASNDDRA